MSELDDIARRAAHKLRADADARADPEGALAALKNNLWHKSSTGSGNQRGPSWMVAAGMIGAVSIGAGALVLWPSNEPGTVVSPTVVTALRPATSVVSAATTVLTVAPPTTFVQGGSNSTSTVPEAELTESGIDLHIPGNGAGPAPIIPLATIPWGAGRGELLRVDGPPQVALLPGSVVAVERSDSNFLTGKGVRITRTTGEFVGEAGLYGVDEGEQLGVVGSPNGQLLVRMNVAADPADGFVTRVLEELEVGVFGVVGQTSPSTELGDGTYRPSPVAVDVDGNIEFGRYPQAGQADARVVPGGGTYTVERTNGGTATQWVVRVELNGGTEGRAEAFLDGALFIATKWEGLSTFQDLAFLDPMGTRTVSWRLTDGWQLTDHDQNGALVVRGTSDGLELGFLDTSSLLPPTVPVPYFASRSVEDGDVFLAVDEFSVDGEFVATVAQSGPNPPARRILLDDGSLLGPSGGAPDGRCNNHPTTVSNGSDETILHPDLPEARDLVATPDGVVIASRDVCPPGTRWGDEGTRWELVRLDLNELNAEVEIIRTQRPDGDVLFESDEIIVALGEYTAAVSADGRFVSLQETLTSEWSRWTILDATSADLPIGIPSACTAPGDVLATPVFLDSQVVVVRLCDEDRVVVEVVNLELGTLVSSIDDPRLGHSGYTRLVNLSAISTDTGVVAILSWADVEQPTTAMMITQRGVIDISEQGYTGFGFTPADAVGN